MVIGDAWRGGYRVIHTSAERRCTYLPSMMIGQMVERVERWVLEVHEQEGRG
jgi:hypothetical protein